VKILPISSFIYRFSNPSWSTFRFIKSSATSWGLLRLKRFILVPVLNMMISHCIKKTYPGYNAITVKYILYILGIYRRGFTAVTRSKRSVILILPSNQSACKKDGGRGKQTSSYRKLFQIDNSPEFFCLRTYQPRLYSRLYRWHISDLSPLPQEFHLWITMLIS